LAAQSLKLNQGFPDELWGVVLPEELPEPELLVPEELLPPGVSAAPVADLPDIPKYENTLWRQLG